MARGKVRAGGGWPAIVYSLRMAKKAGGIGKLYKALRSSNTCKTCAIGMGGVEGGMRNELGQGLQVCKKSMQAQAQDMQPGIPKSFFERHSLAELSRWSGRQLEAAGRLVHPLYSPKGAQHFQLLDWPRAMEILLERWQAASPDRSFFYTSGRSSMEAAFLIQLLARQWGTNNVNNCSYYCHQASGVGLSQVLGTGTSTVKLEDLQKADLVVLIGANPASNHPRFMTYLAELKRRGGKVVVINPFKEVGLQHFRVPSDLRSLFFGSKISDLYLQPHCGGDLTLLKAAALLSWRHNKISRDFLAKYCQGWQALEKDLKSADLDTLLQQSGIAREELEKFCDCLWRSKSTIFAWAMGITHHERGVDNVRAIANLALMRGMIGKPGAGLLPIRGHSNVQGVGSVGVIPKLKPHMVQTMLKHLNIEVPAAPGMDTFRCVQAADDGAVDFAVLVGGNLYAANPDLEWSAQALNNIGFTASLSTTLNLGHIHGRGQEALILPVRARDEEKQSTSQESMFNYVRLSNGGQAAPAPDLPTESEILVQAGERLFGEEPVPWSRLQDHHEIRRFISKTVPAMQPISELDQGREFTIPGRIKHTPEFSTESGRANLTPLAAYDARPSEGHFNLMTMRSEGQFNTIVYEDKDLYRGVEHRLVVFMNRSDIRKLDLTEEEWIWVESEIGKMKAEVVEGPIRAGNLAMYYPEANAIVPARVDPQSRTPVFKCVSVRVYAEKEMVGESEVQQEAAMK
ncbi:FdhF/YdeP family oxidoreductase [bacterium]|nr:FdhF/YdeP family oxidoreductase [bacterium]